MGRRLLLLHVLIYIKWYWTRINIKTGPEGLEPSTSCSAGSHSIQAELWAQGNGKHLRAIYEVT